jgi:DNA-binding MarR family transcriptional regulator
LSEDRRFELGRFLPFRVVALGQAMGQSLAREYADEFGLSIPEWRVLALIGQHEAVTAARVVQDTPMDKATVSRAAARLIEKGLVEKIPHAADKRAAVLSLSDEGADIFSRVSHRALDYEARLLETLSPQDRMELDRLLTLLSEACTE